MIFFGNKIHPKKLNKNHLILGRFILTWVVAVWSVDEAHGELIQTPPPPTEIPLSPEIHLTLYAPQMNVMKFTTSQSDHVQVESGDLGTVSAPGPAGGHSFFFCFPLLSSQGKSSILIILLLAQAGRAGTVRPVAPLPYSTNLLFPSPVLSEQKVIFFIPTQPLMGTLSELFYCFAAHYLSPWIWWESDLDVVFFCALKMICHILYTSPEDLVLSML